MNTQVTVPAPAVEVVQGDDFWIVVKDLVSAQQRPIGETDFEPLFSGVSFSVKAGEVFSISASDKAEAHALCRVLGTLCPYYSGQCRIGKYGTPQKKRRMLPHLFNIDMPQMLVDHVTVLQQLMPRSHRRSRSSPPTPPPTTSPARSGCWICWRNTGCRS